MEKGDKTNDMDNDDHMQEIDEDGNPIAGEGKKDKQTKQKKKKSQKSTIIRNKELLNAKLEIEPFKDPFMNKLNAVQTSDGPNRALMNLLPTYDSEMQIM